MKKLIGLFVFSLLFLSIPKPKVYAGMQPLTPENVKKVLTTSASQSDFCKLEIGDTDVKNFSEALLRGYGSEGQDPFVTTLDKLKCTKENKEIIYGTLEITRNIPSVDNIYEQVFVIDDHYLRPTNLYNEFYRLTPTIPESPQTDTSIMGIFKGVSVKKGSLKHLSDVENNNYGDENYFEGEREFGYLIHLNTEGSIDNIYVLYQGNIYKYLQTLKEIKDVLLVDYTHDKEKTTPTPDPTTYWKTYQGNGFSFKYPSSMTSNNSTDIFYFNSEKEETLNIYGSNFPLGLAESIKDDLHRRNATETTFLGKPAILSRPAVHKLPGEPYKIMIVYLKDENREIDISYLGTGKNEELFDQILSTFKFTDSQTIDTSNWKTYVSSDFKYTFNYPKLLELQEYHDPKDSKVIIDGIRLTANPGPTDGSCISIEINLLELNSTNIKPWIEQNNKQTLSGTGTIVPKTYMNYTNSIDNTITGFWIESGSEAILKSIFIPKNDKYIEFVSGACAAGDSYKYHQETERIIENVISSFKFTN